MLKYYDSKWGITSWSPYSKDIPLFIVAHFWCRVTYIVHLYLVRLEPNTNLCRGSGKLLSSEEFWWCLYSIRIWIDSI